MEVPSSLDFANCELLKPINIPATLCPLIKLNKVQFWIHFRSRQRRVMTDADADADADVDANTILIHRRTSSQEKSRNTGVDLSQSTLDQAVLLLGMNFALI